MRILIVALLALPLTAQVTPKEQVCNSSGSLCASVTANGIVIQGAGTAGATAGGVITIQGSASGTAVPISGTVTITPSGTQDVNEKQVNGTTVDTNSGNKSAGTQRVVLATDQPQLTNPLKVDVLGNAGATLDAAPGAAVPTNALQVGNTDGTNIRVSYKDACDFLPWIYYPVNVSNNTQIAAATASTYYLVCEAIFPNQATAVNMQLVEGTGSVCASNTAGLMGGATAALGANIPANGGFIATYAGRAVAATAVANHALCIFTSASVNGLIAYVATTVAP